ncbi:MAG: hypothetical protein K9I25_04000 [Crocinitomicaceae bacterium]|nr:hypothetical protein [Crocinitomicaceae bacterium]
MKFSKLIIILFAIITSSCTRFYIVKEDRKLIKYTEPKENSWENLDSRNIILVHQGTDIFELTSVTYNANNNQITGRINGLISTPLYYYNKAINKPSHIAFRKFGDRISELRQVHLFINDVSMNENGACSLNLNDIYKVDISKQAEAINALAAIPIVAAGGIGYLAILCGCPHVYVDNGEQFIFEKTLFTGAKAPQLERSDLKNIPDYFPDNNQLSLTIINEEEEEQYIDKLSLLVVEHASGAELAVNKDGEIIAYESIIPAESVVDQDGTNQEAAVKEKDKVAYDFKPEKLTDLSALYATFNPSLTAGKSSLILHVKNTKWSGYLYNEFNKLFGSEHTKWVEKNNNKSKEDREAWMRQEGIKLLVEVKQNGQWESLTELELVGDVAYEKLAIPVVVNGAAPLEIRLRSGFHFWKIDYMGLATTHEELIVNRTRIQPASVVDKYGNSNTDNILNSDNIYMSSTPEDTVNTIRFEGIPVNQKFQRSLFIEAEGHYLMKSAYTGKPNYKRLSKFKKPGELSRFSKELYTELQKTFSFQ